MFNQQLFINSYILEVNRAAKYRAAKYRAAKKNGNRGAKMSISLENRRHCIGRGWSIRINHICVNINDIIGHDFRLDYHDSC